MATAEEVLIRADRARGEPGASSQLSPTAPTPRRPRPRGRKPAARGAGRCAGAASRPAETPTAAPRRASPRWRRWSDQVEATTVYDRDSAARAPAREGRRRRLPADARARRRRLVERAAAPRPDCRRSTAGSSASSTRPTGRVRDLARLYIRFGFGAEAEALLEGFERRGRGPRAARRSRAGGRRRAGCRRRARSRSTPPARATTGSGSRSAAPRRPSTTWRSSPAVQAAFAGLPPDLRGLLGPPLDRPAARRRRAAEARLIHDTAIRPGETADAGLDLAAARLDAAEGHPARRSGSWRRWSRPTATPRSRR